MSAPAATEGMRKAMPGEKQRSKHPQLFARVGADVVLLIEQVFQGS